MLATGRSALAKDAKTAAMTQAKVETIVVVAKPEVANFEIFSFNTAKLHSNKACVTYQPTLTTTALNDSMTCLTSTHRSDAQLSSGGNESLIFIAAIIECSNPLSTH